MRKLFLILMTLIACTWGVQAQSHTYHGTVVDASDNSPLVGVTIMPIGGGQGVATDVDGEFTITVPASVNKAKVSYVGYATQTVELHDNITIYMHNAATALDNVVVVAYGTASKESLTGSVAVVGSQEIEDRPVTSVTAALEGKAPGVQVNGSTTTPGQAPTIRIRGFNSINGTNAPLYVVDGVPFEGDISDLNPADIESMSVLKDAASSSLYGNRGANGVVLITTKRAKNVGNIDVTLNIRQGMYNRGLPFYDRLDQNSWMQQQFDAAVNGYIMSSMNSNNPYAVPTSEQLSQARAYWAGGPIITERIHKNIYGGTTETGQPIGFQDNELFDPSTGKFKPTSYLPGYTDLDWWNAVARHGYRQEYNVNAAGATDKFSAFASVGYLKENGYMLQTDFDRFTARVNATYQPTKYMRLGINFSGTQQESQTGNVETSNLGGVNNPFTAQFETPVYPYYAHNSDGSIIYEDGKPVWNDPRSPEGSYLQNNVAWELRENVNNFSKTALDGNAFITAIIPYGFEFTLRGQLFRNKTIYTGYNNNIVGSQATVGMLNKEYDTSKSHTFMQTLTWEHQYGDNHIDVLLDHENYNYYYDYDYIQKSSQLLDGFLNFNNFENLQYMNSGAGQVRTESYLGRVRYNYDQKYFFEASIRRDGSSRFSKDKRWGTFWSVGGSWIITKEKFLQNVDWLNYLKLRAAYGTVGNDASAPYYAYQTYYGFSQGLGGLNTLLPEALGNPDLKWESTNTFDVALEGSLFNDRFNFSIGYFHKYNSDLLFKVSLPASSGSLSATGSSAAVWRNVGDMLNRGWELQFGVDIIRTKDIKWDFSIDGTFLKNTIKKLPDHDLPGSGLYVGKSIYQIQTIPWAGVDQLTGQSMYEIDPRGINYMSFDENNEMYFNETLFNQNVESARNDKAHVFIEENGRYFTSNYSYASSVALKDALPTVYGSFGTNFSWKGISLGLLFTYQLGGYVLDSNYASLMSGASTYTAALSTDILNSWTAAPAGMTESSPNRIDPNGVPQLNAARSSFNNYSSSRYMTSASYMTLKNLNIAYSLPQKWVKVMKMKDLTLGAYIDNVFIVSKRKGMNPTYSFGGGQGRYYVPARVFAFQLQAKF